MDTYKNIQGFTKLLSDILSQCFGGSNENRAKNKTYLEKVLKTVQG